MPLRGSLKRSRTTFAFYNICSRFHRSVPAVDDVSVRATRKQTICTMPLCRGPLAGGPPTLLEHSVASHALRTRRRDSSPPLHKPRRVCMRRHALCMRLCLARVWCCGARGRATHLHRHRHGDTPLAYVRNTVLLLRVMSPPGSAKKEWRNSPMNSRASRPWSAQRRESQEMDATVRGTK